MNNHGNQTKTDETAPDDTQTTPDDADQISPEAVPLTSAPDDDHSTPNVEFHPTPSNTKLPESTSSSPTNANNQVSSPSDDQHPNPVLFTDIPPDNAGLGDVQTDEDVEMKPGDGVTRRKKKWKYRQSMQVLKPVRKNQLKSDMCPLDEVGLLSFLTVSWMTPLFAKAAKKTLEYTDLWRLSQHDGGAANGLRFERLWKEELEKKGLEKASIIKVCFRFVQTRWIVGLCLLLTYMFAMFIISAVLVQKLLQYTEQPTADIGYGLSIVAIILLLNVLRITCDVFYWTFNLRTATRLRCGALTAVFQKVCQLRSLQDRSIGEIVNICTNDSQRLFEVVMFGNFIISSFVLMIACIVAVVMLIGIAGLIGTLGTFMVLWPFQMVIGKMTASIRQKCILITDERVKKMNELLTYIKLIKMYAWERPFARTIEGIRLREERHLVKSGYYTSWSITLSPITPNIATVITILVHVALGNKLTASEVFTLVAILNVLKFVIGPTPWAIRCIAEGVVAVRRLQSILMMEEIKPLKSLPTDSPYAITINKGTFAWDKPKASENSTKDEEIVFTTNEDGSVLCYDPSGSLHGEETNPNGNVPHDEEKYANPEEVPLRHEEEETKTKGVSWNGSVMVDGKEGGDMIKVEEEIPMAESKKQLNGGVGDEKVVKKLFGIDLELEKGQLIGICGSVGSGKSSLLSAVLGNMHTLEGAIHINGSFAYAAQEPWIYNATMEDNILFGKPMDKVHYDEVIERCSLRQDIQILPSGDQTEIGERGINLSGGQKQRVSLARALYADRDIYLLDDPLSAVDAHVGQHIFTECVKGALKDKTVLFVTHQLQYLKECDSIITIADGCIAERGHHEELMADDGEYARLINTHHKTEEEHRDIIKEIDSDAEEAELQPLMRQISDMSIQSSLGAKGSSLNIASDIEQGGDLMTDEVRQQGSVKWSTYNGYIKAGGYGWCALMAVFYIIVVGSLTFNNWWLSYWISQEFYKGGAPQVALNESLSPSGRASPTYAPDDNESTDMGDWDFYMIVYGCSLLGIIIFGGMKSMITMTTLLRASSNLHRSIFAKVMSSPMSFFDTTPTGRILNRFSKDLDELDVMLPLNMELFVQNFLIIIFALITISAILPWFLIAVVPITILYIVILRYYRRAVRDMKRIENVSRSPWFSHISATVQGLSTIRAYNKNKEFADRFVTLLDDNSLPLIMFRLAARWAGVRLETLVTLVSTTTNVLVVLLHGQISPALAGLAIAYSVQITGMLQLMVLMASETEARFTSAERIINYIKTLKSEAPAQVKGKQPPANWPKEGEVVVKDYSMRYREGLPLVLNNINCHIKPKEKIGIVGRTGSGKSSLGIGLFRLVEPASGDICIDQLNISSMGLEDLRSRLSIIPQDPVLFIGTIRYNLDPFAERTDAQLWQALERTYMKDKVSQLEQKLQAPVVEGGDNFSVGERQLLCMARALLRNSKILMLDEATAAIDTETDSLVQATIREAFSDCTMLTIAHRLNTILDSDRVLLMENGEIAEFDTPSILLSNPDSKFSKMLEAAKVNKKDLAKFKPEGEEKQHKE